MGRVKRKCARCQVDLAHRNYVKLVVDGEIITFCPNCACGVKNNEKTANARNDRNRMLSGRNVHSR